MLARASDSRSLDSRSLEARIRATVEKYLLKDDESASDQSIVEFMDGLQADDLCLIVACERGEETAWSDLVERFTPTVRSAARAASGTEEGAEDLAQSIWAELYGLRIREDGKPASKLAYYSGRGSLAGWLRAVVSQLAVDQHRRQSRLIQTEEDADFDRLARDGDEGKDGIVATAAVNPEHAVSDKFAENEIQDALRRSIAELSADDRLLVKLYYFEKLRLREAGAVLGVHEATASRRLTKIQGNLRDRVENILIKDRGWTKAETERCFSEVALQMDADLEPMLATGGSMTKVETEASKTT